MEKAQLLKRGDELSFKIPVELLQEFKNDVRIVIRHPWVIGIPAPEFLIKADNLRKFKEFDVMLVPKEIYR